MNDLPEVDDGMRGEVAVSVSVRDEGGGRVRVIIDDLRRSGGRKYPDWKTHSFVTWGTIGRDELCGLSFTDEKALGLGQLVLARLGARMKG